MLGNPRVRERARDLSSQHVVTIRTLLRDGEVLSVFYQLYESLASPGPGDKELTRWI